MSSTSRIFPALLKYWRARRGLSQLELGLAADVSVKHVGFLEIGRSKPSSAMVLRLAETLDVPLRSRNEMLRGAGFAAAYPEPDVDDVLAGPIGRAIETMLLRHEPLPMMLFDRLYNVIELNRSAALLFEQALPQSSERNMLRRVFEPRARQALKNWQELATLVLRRLQREVLYHPHDEAMRALLDHLLAQPGIPNAWRQPELEESRAPFVPMSLLVGDVELRFLVSVTVFDAPENITLGELRVESWYPLDDGTTAYCHEHFGDG